MTTKYKFKCRFCGKPFVRENYYLKHECKEMKRAEEFRTPIGQAAWRFYQRWLAKNNKRVISHESFLTSHYYNAFINYAKFVKNMRLPDPDRFIWLMVQKKYSPHVWTEDTVYRTYLEFLDLQGDPLDRAGDTIKSIQRMAREKECKIYEIFDHMTAPELYHRLYTRELSPWLLFHSKRFWDFYNTKTDTAVQAMIDSLIRLDFWKTQFAKHPKVHNDLKNMVKRLNL